MTGLERKHVRLALVLSLLVAAVGVLALVTEAKAGEPGPEEYDVTERYCRPEPSITTADGLPQPWFPTPSPNMLQLRPPILPPWGGAPAPKLAAFVALTRVYGEVQAKRIEGQGWILLTRRMIYCSNFFAHDQHNARLQWHVLTIKFSDDGNADNDLQREDWTHCRMVQARFPNVVHPGSTRCSSKFKTIISRLGS